MNARELLRKATQSAQCGYPLQISTDSDRQPLPGFRLELLSVGSNGSWNWILSPKQVVRLEKLLRGELREELQREHIDELGVTA